MARTGRGGGGSKSGKYVSDGGPTTSFHGIMLLPGTGGGGGVRAT